MTNRNMSAMPYCITEENRGWEEGLTKREYLAAMAMQGLLASGYFDDPQHRISDVTDEAINHADALLAELERTQ